MLDDILNIGPSFKDSSFHFQIIPLFLSICGRDTLLPAQGTTYRFSVHKGHHKFDQNRHPIEAHFSTQKGVPTMPVSACKLNFFIPNYNKLKRHDFILKMTQRECNQDFSIGQYYIEAGALIDSFKNEGKKRNEVKTFFSMDYQLDFEIYIEQNRNALEAVVKDYQEQRKTKQPNPTILQGKNEERQKEQFGQIMKIASSSEGQPEQQKEIVAQLPKNQKGVQVKHKSLFRLFSKEADISPSSDIQQDSSKANKVPLIQTKFKQLAKIDTPHVIRKKESSRLSEYTLSCIVDDEPSQGFQRKTIFMWIYIMIGTLVMYISMHPIKKS